MLKKNYLLACESSCDETAFSIFDMENKKVIHSIIMSQALIHKKNGGVIPELASRYHFITLLPLLRSILNQSQLTLDNIEAFAVTQGPGLPGALSLGFTFMKALAIEKKKPLIPVNHLEGHIYSSFLTHDNIPFPHLCLSLSGGHSTISFIKDFFSYEKLGETRDDACGECFDKIAKLLNLPYPGGRYIEEYTIKNDNYDNIRNYPISDLKDGTISFSGLKTAILYDIIKHNLYDQREKRIIEEIDEKVILEIATSAQYVITKMIEKWILFFIEAYPHIKAVTLVGGVACNTILKKHLELILQEKNILFFYPEKKYCCDNADMIAFVATKNYLKNEKNGYYQYNIGIKI